MTLRRRRGENRSGLAPSLLSLALFFGASGSAWAQADAQHKAAAEALFEEGKQLRSRGQFESACHKFEQSQDIDPAAGTLLYLGECYERIGKTASAWATFRASSSRATAAGQTDRARMADDYANKLTPRLSKLMLNVPAQDRDAIGFELLLDGRLLSPALYGVPFPVDPGAHQITARAPGRNSWSSSIEVGANADARNVDVPLLEAGSLEPAPPRPSSVPPEAMFVAPLAAGEPQRPDRGRDNTAGYVLGGIGVGAFGFGAVFGLRAADKDSDSKSACPSACSTPQGAKLNEEARSSALIANVSYAVGGAALLTSAYLLFIAGSGSDSASSQPPGLALGASFGAADGLVSVSGSF